MHDLARPTGSTQMRQLNAERLGDSDFKQVIEFGFAHDMSFLCGRSSNDLFRGQHVGWRNVAVSALFDPATQSGRAELLKSSLAPQTGVSPGWCWRLWPRGGKSSFMPQIDLEPEHYRDKTPLKARWGQLAMVSVAAVVAIGWVAVIWLARQQPVLVVGVSTVAVVVIAALLFIGAWLRTFD